MAEGLTEFPEIRERQEGEEYDEIREGGQYDKYKLLWEKNGEIHIPLVTKLIDRAIAIVRGSQMQKIEISKALGLSAQTFSNRLSDDQCTYDTISKVCDWLEIPVYLFAHVSQLSPNYEKIYAKNSAQVLEDFENKLRHFLNRSPYFQPYQSVFDTPDHYEPPHSSEVGIKVFTRKSDAWIEKPRLDWSNPTDRKANVAGVKPVRPDFQFYDGEFFRFEISSSKVGRNVIILETDMTPHRPYSWALINGRPPGGATGIGPVKRESGSYDGCHGEWSGSSGMCRVAVAVVDPSVDTDKWRDMDAGAICPPYMLNALAEAVKADPKLCWLGTFTYEMTPRLQRS